MNSKIFVTVCILVLASGVIADNNEHKDTMIGSSYGGSAPSYSAPAKQSYSAPAAPAYKPQSYAAPAMPSYSAPSYSAPAAPSYSAPMTIPAPQCAKNYLFSCSPSLSPVPCASPQPSYSAPSYSAPSGGYGSAGAYSQFVPQYAYPQMRY